MHSWCLDKHRINQRPFPYLLTAHCLLPSAYCFLLAAPQESVYTWARLRVAVESLVRADNDGRILASHHQAMIIH